MLLLLGVCSVTIFSVLLLFIASAMGTRSRKSEPDISSSDNSSGSEDDLTVEQQNDEKTTCNHHELDTDAVNPEGKKGNSVGLGISDIEYIENNLADYEKISLIFLLSDDPQNCLKGITLSKWYSEAVLIYPFWEEQLWEALAIVKNFQIPKIYGFLKDDLIKEYFPFNQFFTKNISKFRKALYFICENFKEADEKLYLQALKEELEMKKLSLPKFPQMEMYFSFLLKIGYISSEDTRDCARLAKKLELEEICVFFENIQSKTSTKKLTQRTLAKPVARSISNITSDEIHYREESLASAFSDSTQDNVPTRTRETSQLIYNNSGRKICLIIDQRNFYTEVEEKYKHLLPPNIEEDKLNSREGTQVDSERLKSVFERRGFDVIIEPNLNHIKTINVLEEIVESINILNFSMLFVFILSHGNQGVVYCSNSCFVRISKIIEIMSHKKLINFPKVLVLQTCQGQNLQHADEDLTTDGESSPNDSDDPKTPNFFLYTSTVPGFASIRDKKRGSWFIQALCDQIELLAEKEHFLDICTTVTNKVSALRWKKKGKTSFMLSYKRDTFLKKLYI